jgi:hypothetical protein
MATLKNCRFEQRRGIQILEPKTEIPRFARDDNLGEFPAAPLIELANIFAIQHKLVPQPVTVIRAGALVARAGMPW